jgi:hypothetical protein
VNIASQQTHSSLAQRLAKVRNCMLVELSTSVSVTDKDLFVSLCQTYEQNGVETSCTASASSQNVLDQALSTRIAGIPEGDTPSRQQRIGFSIVRWPNFEGFGDWDDWSDK